MLHRQFWTLKHASWENVESFILLCLERDEIQQKTAIRDAPLNSLHRPTYWTLWCSNLSKQGTFFTSARSTFHHLYICCVCKFLVSIGTFISSTGCLSVKCLLNNYDTLAFALTSPNRPSPSIYFSFISWSYVINENFTPT